MERLRRTLRSLGSPSVSPTIVAVQKRAPEHSSLAELAQLTGGDLLPAAVQDGYLAVRHVYPITHKHGHAPLSLMLEARPDTLALLARDPRLATIDPSSAVYFDTETTGLGTAAGTLAFLVGVGRFTGDTFEVVQHFLPGPQAERPFLAGVREFFGDDRLLVSYNGKCFDAPLLQTRYLLQRQRLSLTSRPHLDLLRAARGLYRARVPDCRLGTIERLVLGVEREESDVPGFLIPGIYFEYLRSGAVGELARVFYHNLLDVLSLASLGGAAAAAVEGRSTTFHTTDQSGAARLLELGGRHADAETSYRRALLTARGAERLALMRRLGLLLKRQGDHQGATEIWTALIDSGADQDGLAHTELAKHLEHRIRDYVAALAVVERALQTGAHLAPGMRAALEHRRARLMAKQASKSPGPPSSAAAAAP